MARLIACYVRVSTEDQAEHGYSIDEQTVRLRKYCEAHGWTVFRVYTDPGFSGAKMDRPALTQLLSDVKLKMFDTVLVYKLDRLSRSQKDTMFLIEDVFLKNEIAFISVCENFDTGTPFGRAMVGILSVFAQLERDQIRDRLIMGRVGRAKSGKYAGGSIPPIGYKYEGGRLVPYEYEAAQVRLAFDLFLHGMDGHEMSLTAISRYLSENFTNRYSSWGTKAEVGELLRDRNYIGEVKFRGVWYPGEHEPLVSREVFDAVQEKYDRRQQVSMRGRRPYEVTHLLTGLLFCGCCGSRMNASTSSRRNRYGELVSHSYYACQMRQRSYLAKKRGIVCSLRRFPCEELESLVLSEVEKLRLDPSVIDELSRPPVDDSENEKRAAVRSRIAEIDSQTRRLLDLYQVDGLDLSSVSSRLQSLDSEKKKLEATLAVPAAAPSRVSASDARTMVSSFSDAFRAGSVSDRRELLRSLIDRIIVFDDRIEIHWAFMS